MKLRTTVVALSLFAAGVLTATALQQEATYTGATKFHALFKKSVGTWSATVTSPDSDGTSTAREVNEMVGELWLSSSFKGQFMGQPFEGRGITGYDGEKKKYVGVWVDTMSDKVLVGEGDFEEDRQALVMNFPAKDEVTQKDIIQKHILKFVDANTRQFKIMVPGPDAKHSKEVLKIDYVKK